MINYLWDPDVLRTCLTSNNCDRAIVEKIIEEWNKLILGEPGTAEIKTIAKKIYQSIRQDSGLKNTGNDYQEFAKSFLVNALRETTSVYDQLRDDIFHPEKTL